MSTINSEIKKNLGSSHPIKILKQWLKAALKIPGLKNPWAMTLSTSTNNQVHSRIVLLKEVKGNNLFFYTNYLSAKGQDIKKNPFVALNFYWPQRDRQIRIEGKARKTSRKQSLLYWKTRSRSSQLSQWISQQSQRATSRKQLEDLKKEAEKKWRNKAISCPKHWGGYSIPIEKIEFWINQNHRLHDRFVFEKTGSHWKKQRLFP